MPPARSGPTAKRQTLTLAQLASYDDILTDALVDNTYYWTTIPKNRPSYHPSRSVKEDEVAKIIQNHLIVEPDLDVAESKFLATGLRSFLHSLKTDKEKDDFKRHLRRYMQLFLPDCPFEVNSTNRYTIFTHEASITARRFIKRNETVKYLSGIQVVITPAEEAELSKRKKDFSIVVSSRSKSANLFMGPARFANHDCDANARLMTTGQAGIEIIAARDIDTGDEITVTYGESYFGEDNCECLCKTCEDNQANGWAVPDADGKAPAVAPVVTRSIEGDVIAAAQGYSLRRRRRDDSTSRALSESPSVTPDIRPRVRKTRPTTKMPLLLAERSSTTDTILAEQRLESLLGAKRKRDTTNLATPPITPAKKQKTAEYDVYAVPATSSRASSVDASTPGTTASEKEAALTDATSLAEDTPMPQPVIHSPKPTPIKRVFELLKQEGSASEIGEVSTPLPSIRRTVEMASPTVVATPQRTPAAAVEPVTPSSMADAATPKAPAFMVPPIPGVLPTAVASEMQALNHPESISAQDIVVSTSPSTAQAAAEPTGVPPASRRGRKRVLPNFEPERLAEHDSPAPRKHRVPGDYTLTPVLLSEPETAWIYCTICSTAFVQRDAYYTRSACPRCERHSKLYGYIWPKTEREGRADKEERVLDHRTVHRFLDAEDEAKIRGRKMPLWRKEGTVGSEAVGTAGHKGKPGRPPGRKPGRPPGKKLGRPPGKANRKAVDEDDEEYEDSEVGGDDSAVRRSGRVRRASAKVAKGF